MRGLLACFVVPLVSVVALAQTPKEMTNSVGMKLVLIPKGTFTMGSKLSPKEVDQRYPGGEEEWYEGETPHQVLLSHSFYMGIHEVTVGQFRNFVEAEKYKTEAETDGKGGRVFDPSTGKFSQNPKYTWRNPGFAQDDNHPVVNVSWNDAVAFCRWLSRVEGREYRLPTEAEWEYSCRAGSSSELSFGNAAEQLVVFGNVADATLKKQFPNFPTVSSSDGAMLTSQVGSYRSNEFGLYDMHGNVWEWCSDWYGEYPRGSVTDPVGAATGSNRVMRGGSWRDVAAICRSACRRRSAPEFRINLLGFRVALVPVASSEFESNTRAGGRGAIAPAVTSSGSVAQNGTKNAQTGDIVEDYRRIKAEYDANTGSLSRDVNAESNQAVAPTWANQEPDPTYDDPREQAIMDSRQRAPTPILDLFYREQAKREIEDFRRRNSEAFGKINLKTRNEFLRGLYRGFDTLQATYQSGLGKLSSLVGDETFAWKYSEAYRDAMRQASENPRNAPTFENMIDDPLGWLAATAGEYALQTVFCTSICAGVLFWISKQRSKSKTQRNNERGFATLVGKETFFWFREFQDDKVVYTYRNYKLFYFLILPLLIAFIGVPVIGLIPILAWTFYWVFYPRPNFELSQMLQRAKCVATGSKLSTVNPMRLTFSRADFDRIVMGRESTTAETTPSSTAPTLLSTHSDSISSDAELESLRKTNEELKRKVEARKLAEKQANDRAALEAENARLMQQLGEGTVSSDLSSDVHPSNVANRNLADRKISGVGGWLALLVAGMLVLGPVWSMFKTGSNIWVTERLNPELASVPQWQTYKIMTWFVVGICVVYSMVSGFLLCVKKEPVSVKNAIAFLWIGGPVAVFVLSVLIPGISLGTEALEEMLPKSIGAIIGTSIVASIWTAYLRKSKRVRNTYYP